MLSTQTKVTEWYPELAEGRSRSARRTYLLVGSLLPGREVRGNLRSLSGILSLPKDAVKVSVVKPKWGGTTVSWYIPNLPTYTSAPHPGGGVLGYLRSLSGVLSLPKGAVEVSVQFRVFRGYALSEVADRRG